MLLLAAKAMTYVSLCVNVAVLLPLCFLMATDHSAVDSAWGAKTPGRGILLSVYTCILAASIYLLFNPTPALVVGLLTMQVVYKLTTPITVGSIKNPVVISNLAISALHLATIGTIAASAFS
jgi:hypothetical protein